MDSMVARRHSTLIAALAVAICGCGDGHDPSTTDDAISNGRQVSTDTRTPPPSDEAVGDADSSGDFSAKPDAQLPKLVKPQAVPQPIFRSSDTRPRHNDQKLAALGILKYESKRLRLYTDVDPELAARIPKLIDAAYAAWEAYFGKLPPNRERTEFQITGYVMADEDRFRTAGLIPADLRPFDNGRHRGAEFWMYDQEYDYYRRHLAVHESTHCFMEAIAGERYYEGLPAWYWEGMAELFGTHRIDEQDRATFCVMPDDRENFAGLGRVTIVGDAVAAGKRKSVTGVAGLTAAEFLEDDAYAWSWALCKFLDTHPAYRKEFHELGNLLTGSRFKRAWNGFLAAHQSRLPAEWALFADGLQYGYDIELAVVEFAPGKPPAGDNPLSQANIRADRGWQSSAIRVERGRKYIVTAAGQFTLAQQPKPWVSEANGISFDFFNGRPLGLLLARIHPDGGEMLPAFPVGMHHEFVAEADGTLYFRLNDSWSRLADNAGSVSIRIRGIE